MCDTSFITSSAQFVEFHVCILSSHADLLHPSASITYMFSPLLIEPSPPPPPTPPSDHPNPHSPHCFWTMESPWYIFRTTELVYTCRTPPTPSLPLPLSMEPKPAIRSGYVQPQQHRNAAICWGHTCWSPNEWLAFWWPPRMAADHWVEGCFRTGCHSLLLCHPSASGMLSPGQTTVRCFHTSKGQRELVFIKSNDVQIGSASAIVMNDYL